ncbi:MAG: GNAT family N-acetyltransferase [Vicingaceae bacterium]
MNFQFLSFPELETARLILRKVTFDDAQIILHIRSDLTINQYIKRDTLKNIEDARTFITKVNAGFEAGENIYWAICLKKNLKMIGSICLWHFDAEAKKAELGYDLKADFQRRGIMSEALKCVLKFGYEKLSLIEIEAFTHFDNKSSIMLLKKNKFSLVKGELDPDNSNNVIYRTGRPLNQ